MPIFRSVGVACVVTVALAGCGGGYEDYYARRIDPIINQVEPLSETGNAGGQVITIRGSNFGSDPDSVVVLIDNHNAEVLSVNNAEITVVTPAGPITGGAVDMLVSTANGYGKRFNAYRYGAADFTDEEGTFYERQTHYVQVTNLYESCYGGIGSGIGGCDSNGAFNGQVGVSGSAEFLQFNYPRLHTTKAGWLTAFDASIDDWRVGSPTPAFPSGIDGLKSRLQGRLTLRNPGYVNDNVCVDLTEDFYLATKSCAQAPDGRPYKLGEMNWCETQDAADGGQYEYQPDWPVNHDFFQNPDPTAGPYDPVEIEVLIPGQPDDVVAWNSPKTLLLPPVVDLVAESGFQEGQLPWAVSGTTQCNDSDGDGEALLNDEGMVLTWTPMDPEVLGGDNVENVNTYLHVSLTQVDFTWYGLETTGVRVSRVFPDFNETFVDEDGVTRSRLVIPNEVLYQLPTPNFSWSSAGELGQPGRLGRYIDNPSYLFMEVYRISDYRMDVDGAQGQGPALVFSYATGEFSLLQDWSNPVTRVRDCTDCLDGDGDGWVDALDPDCDRDSGGAGVDETNSTSTYTCNDGIDNNGNGLTDSEDPLCAAGWDGETTCGDGLDNDGDGWIDALDPGCDPDDPRASEDDGFGTTTCNDGIDNDGDGWVDSGDAACTSGLDSEDDGFLGTACNDGIDQDEHGDLDYLDVTCVVYGAAYDSETPPVTSACRNSRDDDSDGFTDLLDPDCEYRPHNSERNTSHDPANPATPIVNACYDGIDNDGDGAVDADDSSCWNPAYGFAADGFINNEGASWGTGCSDGVDSDGDGWIDGRDPDCVAGDDLLQEEIGFGTTVCNDGIDNDGDGLIDAEDTDYCKSARGTFEGPS